MCELYFGPCRLIVLFRAFVGDALRLSALVDVLKSDQIFTCVDKGSEV